MLKTRTIIKELGITKSVKLKNKDHFNYLILLCKNHPRYDEKFNNFEDFRIYQDLLNPRGLVLGIINKDKTWTEISWKKCIYKTAPRTNFNSALRNCILPQILEFRYSNDLSFCRQCKNKSIVTHIDHDKTQFKTLVNDFLKLNPDIEIPSTYDKLPNTFLTVFKTEDTKIGQLFEKYHLTNATLRVLCETCNLTRPKCTP